MSTGSISNARIVMRSIVLFLFSRLHSILLECAKIEMCRSSPLSIKPKFLWLACGAPPGAPPHKHFFTQRRTHGTVLLSDWLPTD